MRRDITKHRRDGRWYRDVESHVAMAKSGRSFVGGPMLEVFENA